MTKKYISWDEFQNYVEQLAKKIDEPFDTIICINRGGLVIGRILSDILNLPLGVISAKCYEKGSTEAKEAIFHPVISLVGPVGRRVLLVDDLVDTAKTIKKLIKFLKDSYPDIHIKTAVIYKDIKSPYTPDYYLADKNEWIVNPYEINEFK